MSSRKVTFSSVSVSIVVALMPAMPSEEFSGAFTLRSAVHLPVYSGLYHHGLLLFAMLYWKMKPFAARMPGDMLCKR